MKKGYKSKTSLFGSDAEKFFGQLFLMYQNPNGSRRPDFITADGRYHPRLSVELKSGKNHKGVAVDYQLHYAVSTLKDYTDLFGGRESLEDGLLPGISLREVKDREIAYYYDILDRTDTLTTEDLDRPFSSIKMQWGDHILIPADLGFTAFAVSKMMRKKKNGRNIRYDEVERELKNIIQQDLESSTDYEARKDSQSWQNLYGKDFVSIFQDNADLTTKIGKIRRRLMMRHYNFDSLKRISIPGPHGTSIYVLAKPEHEELFDTQVRKVIHERTPLIEAISHERKKAETLLGKIKKVSGTSLLGEEIDPKSTSYVFSGLSQEELDRLKRLSNWLNIGKNQTEDNEMPKKPDDDIPF